MYSLEERTKAVLLFIESDCSESTVIRTLGYPSPNALRSWYKEYISTGNGLADGRIEASFMHSSRSTLKIVCQTNK